jgi:hypothetical protein
MAQCVRHSRSLQAQHRGFARARPADHADHLPRRNIDRHIHDHLLLTKPFAEMVEP